MDLVMPKVFGPPPENVNCQRGRDDGVVLNDHLCVVSDDQNMF